MAVVIEIPMSHHGRAARMRVSPCVRSGWDVRADIEGEEILREHCSSWQRVERLRVHLQTRLRATAATPHPVKHHPMVAGIVLALLLGASGIAAQPAGDVSSVFQHRVNDYIALRQRVGADVAPEHIIDPRIREVSGALLAARLRQARAGALPGDVFSAGMSELIRYRLHRAFDATEIDVLLMDLYPDGMPRCGTAAINSTYPSTVAVAPPMTILGALPPVPGALGYRLIGRDLVLWDEDAGLVVDVVVEALPEPRIWRLQDLGTCLT